MPYWSTSHTRRSDGVPDPDGALQGAVRIKIRHYRNVYLNRRDPITFLPLVVDTSGLIFDDFWRLLFFHDHREVSVLVNALSFSSSGFIR